MDDQLALSLYQKLYDEDSGRFYFFDRRTGISSFYKPAGVSATLPSSSDYHYYDNTAIDYSEEWEGEGVTNDDERKLEFEEEPEPEPHDDALDSPYDQTGILAKNMPIQSFEPELTAFDSRITRRSTAFHNNPESLHRDSIYPWVRQTNLSSVLPVSVVPTRRANSGPGLSYLDSASLLNGPYCQRIGVGKQIVRSIHRLPDQATSQDRCIFAAERGDRLFVSARDIMYKEGAWGIGDEVNFFDERELKSSTLEPMMLLRAAVEDGPKAVVGVMEKHSENPQVQVFGLMNLAKLTYTEKADGSANEGGVAAMGLTIRVMKQFVSNGKPMNDL